MVALARGPTERSPFPSRRELGELRTIRTSEILRHSASAALDVFPPAWLSVSHSAAIPPMFDGRRCEAPERENDHVRDQDEEDR
jgi:hypothetical protein